VVTDGSSLWVVDDGATDTVYKYTIGGTLLGGWTIDPANGSPTGITIDPNSVGHIWIVDRAALKVFQYSNAAAFTGDYLLADRTFTLAPGNTNPQDIADPPPSDSLSETFAPVSRSTSPAGLNGTSIRVNTPRSGDPELIRPDRAKHPASLQWEDSHPSGSPVVPPVVDLQNDPTARRVVQTDAASEKRLLCRRHLDSRREL
jgi:hypothetical protein